MCMCSCFTDAHSAGHHVQQGRLFVAQPTGPKLSRPSDISPLHTHFKAFRHISSPHSSVPLLFLAFADGLLTQSLVGLGMGNLCLPAIPGGPVPASLLGTHPLNGLGLGLGLTMDCRPGSALGSGGLGSAGSSRQAGAGGAGGDEFFNLEEFVHSSLAGRLSAEPR